MNNIKSQDYASIMAKALGASEWIEINSRDPGAGGKALSEISDKAQSRLLALANSARAASYVSAHPTAIGVFGASQVGKSFLVNTLAAGGEHITTNWGGVDIDFLGLVNPTGNNHEATGVATRFTHEKGKSLSAGGRVFPVEFKIMRPVEIAMILANSFNNDLSIESDEKNALNEALYTDEALEASVKAALDNQAFRLEEGAAPIIDAADAVLMAGYVKGICAGFDLGKQEIDGPYWSAVRRAAPLLNLDGLCALLAPLWGGMGGCTLIFKKVAGEIARLGGAREAFTGLDAFISWDGQEDSPKQQKHNTVNSIQTVSLLFAGAGDPIDVAVEDPDGQARVVSKVDFACLAAATIELVFPLSEEGGAGNFDIIDFPGARERNKEPYKSFLDDEEQNRTEIAEGRPTEYIRKNSPEMLRRGKVAYIFDRYTEDRAVDVLLLCLSTYTQAEVTSLTPIIDKWISLNIGATPAERAKAARSPFLCVLTRCDQTVEADIDRTDGTPSGASAFITKSFEKFIGSKWLHDWNGKPFSQIFMVRSPGWADRLFKKGDDRKELGFSDGTTKSTLIPIKQAVMEYRDGVASDKLAGQIYGGALNAFDSMLALNDGGVSMIKDFISKNFAGYNESRTRLDTRIEGQARDALSYISPFAGAGSGTKRDAALEKARFIASGLSQCDETSCIQGYIRTLLELDDGDLRERYLRDYTEYKNAPRFAQACIDVLKEKLSGLCSGAGFDALLSMVDDAWTNGASSFTRFEDAKERYSFFYDQVKSRFIKSGAELRERFATLMQDLCQALRESAFSTDLQGRLEKALEENETLGGRQDVMASIQVRTAQQMISGFLCFLGFDLPGHPSMAIEKRSEVVSGADDLRPLFSEKVELAKEPQNEGNPVSTLPLVSDELMASSGRHYLEDFLWALSSLMCGRNLQSGSPYRFSEDSQNEIDRILSGFAKFLSLKAA